VKSIFPQEDGFFAPENASSRRQTDFWLRKIHLPAVSAIFCSAKWFFPQEDAFLAPKNAPSRRKTDFLLQKIVLSDDLPVLSGTKPASCAFLTANIPPCARNGVSALSAPLTP